MKVTVYHRETIDPRQEQADFESVAIVNAEGIDSVEQALEYAYRATNNIDGSWSMGSTIEWQGETHVNNDFDPNVEFIGEYPVGKDGTVYGARSTSMMDMMVVDGDMYEVAGMGFKKVHNTGIKLPA